MRKRTQWFLFLVPFALWALPPSPGHGALKKLPRKILAFYDPAQIPGTRKDIFFLKTHRRAEMPLNHLGMEVALFDITQPWPRADALTDFRGVLCWFDQPAPYTEKFCSWLNQALAADLKVVILGGAAFPQKDIPLGDACQSFYQNMGVEMGPQLPSSPLFYDIAREYPTWASFERKLEIREIEAMPHLMPTAPEFIPLRIQNKQDKDIFTCPIVVTKKGGFALNPFVLYQNNELDPHQSRWRLNPFLFFEAAFGLKGWPRPDTTTMTGTRLYFSHVDGDGFFNISEVDNKSWSGAVFLEKILKTYASAPFTVSVITGYYDMPRFGTEAAGDLTKTILNLPNVEPASHGHAHPLDWDKEVMALNVPGYVFEPHREIAGSLKIINENFLPPEKKTRLFLWTGDCLPVLGQLSLAENLGLLNLNGGDSRFDDKYKSYGYVSPLSRGLGGYRQIYSANANENIYTDLWRGPFYGYHDVIKTFENTEYPLRVKPVNVYVHFYSAEKLASLKSLDEVYQWVFSQKYFSLFAGDYVQIVKSFFEIDLYQAGEAHYQAKNSGAMKTLRFDGESRHVDMEKSKGVLGYSHFQKALYVFLNESQNHDIVLSHAPSKAVFPSKANFFIRNWSVHGQGVSFQAKGWGQEMTLRGLSPGRYKVKTPDDQFLLNIHSQKEVGIAFPRGLNPKAYEWVEVEKFTP